ncbi:MAG: hypothetical protein KGZ83_14580 [Sulfuricella sp.]|nr:hypothetical protein [Sulfuricella sp.]
MNKTLLAVAALALLGTVKVAAAAGGYNDVPPGDAQFKQCVTYANKNYEGGNAKSPVPGQSKVVAFCECMWNETPDDFRGNLAKFSESDKGKKVNKICEKHSNWTD